LKHRWTPPLRLKVSDFSTFLMMCDVSSMAVCRRESIECCPGIVYKYFLKLTYNSRGPSDYPNMTKHFKFHIRWISVIIIIIIILLLLCSFITGFLFPGSSSLEPMVNPRLQFSVIIIIIIIIIFRLFCYQAAVASQYFWGSWPLLLSAIHLQHRSVVAALCVQNKFVTDSFYVLPYVRLPAFEQDWKGLPFGVPVH
jgi:hypothetical protein